MNNIIENIKAVNIGKEKFYKLTDAVGWLENNLDSGLDIDITEIIITPFYIEENKKYEIYHKEFDYDKLDILKEDSNILVLINYFLEILSCSEIKEEIQTVFSEFNTENLYFVLYN